MGDLDFRFSFRLADLVASWIYRQWQVAVCWSGITEQLLQVDLSRRRVEQVGTAHDFGNILYGIIHHHGKLVGEQAVSALDDEITAFGLDVLRLFSHYDVIEGDGDVLSDKTQRMLFGLSLIHI